MIPPCRVDLGMNRSDSHVIRLKLSFLLNILISELSEVFPESDLNISDTNIQIGHSLLELPASQSKVALHLIKQSIVFGVINSWIISVKEAASE